MLRLATFNVENLFQRPAAMNTASDSVGRSAIEHHAELNAIIAKALYSTADKERLVDLSRLYGFHLPNPPKNAYIFLQKLRGRLFKKLPNGSPEVVATGRSDWTGWFELRRDDVKWAATCNTGRIIAEVNPDIIVLVEVDNRPTVERFNTQVLGALFDCEYPHVMVIDGNDARGIDVGILSRFPILEIRSHVDDADAEGHLVFSRDCPEYDVQLGPGIRLVVVPNHLKSQRNGNDQASQDRRRLQADRAHGIAKCALARSRYVVVAGDLNDAPTSPCLTSLFDDGFRDVQDHPSYPQDRPGTYETGTAKQKFDYLILSPALFAADKLKKTGIERRGSYHPRTWAPLDTVTKKAEEASDHHLVWADFDFGL